jgi:hypothetical protein
VTEISGRRLQPDSDVASRSPRHSKRDLSSAEMAVALADVRDESEILARVRPRQFLRIASWATFGGLFLLFGAATGSVSLFVVSFLGFLAAATKCPSYLRNQARWRELREMHKSLLLDQLEPRPSDP